MHALEAGLTEIALKDFTMGKDEQRLQAADRARLVRNAQLTRDEARLVRLEFDRVSTRRMSVCVLPDRVCVAVPGRGCCGQVGLRACPSASSIVTIAMSNSTTPHGTPYDSDAAG